MNSAGTYSAYGRTGPLPQGESGLALTVHTFKRGPLYHAAIRVETDHGPILFSAAVDERHLTRAMALARQLVRQHVSPAVAVRRALATVASTTPPASVDPLAPKVPFAAVPSSVRANVAKALATRQLVEQVRNSAPEKVGPLAPVVSGMTATIADRLQTLDRAYRGDPGAQRTLVGLARVAQSPTPAGKSAARSLLHADRVFKQGVTRITTPAARHRWGVDIWRLLAERIRQRTHTRSDQGGGG